MARIWNVRVLGLGLFFGLAAGGRRAMGGETFSKKEANTAKEKKAHLVKKSFKRRKKKKRFLEVLGEGPGAKGREET